MDAEKTLAVLYEAEDSALLRFIEGQLARGGKDQHIHLLQRFGSNVLAAMGGTGLPAIALGQLLDGDLGIRQVTVLEAGGVAQHENVHGSPFAFGVAQRPLLYSDI